MAAAGTAGPWLRRFAFSRVVNHSGQGCASRDQARRRRTMALKVELKPGERILIGDSVITNSDQRTRFVIEGALPVLREKDIMTVERANTPAKRVYLAVQLMYTGRDPRNHHEIYFRLVGEILRAAPSC